MAKNEAAQAAENEDKDTRPRAVRKSETAVNTVIGGLERLGRFGKALSASQKTTALKAIEEGLGHVKQVLAGKAEAKSGFSLGD